MNIVLVEPEIAPNTGNIARLCAVTGSSLHLVRPLGFSTDDKSLKRAGLDYWHLLDITYYDSFQEVKNKFNNHTFYYATTSGSKFYSEVAYTVDDFLVFGPETRGLPKDLLRENEDYCVKIPMSGLEGARSLNLSNSVAIIVYEVLRQNDFLNLI